MKPTGIIQKRDILPPEILALQAAAFIAADERLLSRFLMLTGLSLAAFREMIARREGLRNEDQGAVLDFLLAHEPDLLDFARHAGMEPGEVQAARLMLEDSQNIDFRRKNSQDMIG